MCCNVAFDPWSGSNPKPTKLTLSIGGLDFLAIYYD